MLNEKNESVPLTKEEFCLQTRDVRQTEKITQQSQPIPFSLKLREQ